MKTGVDWLVDNILTKDEIYDDYGNLIGFKLLNTFTSSVDFTEYVEQAKQMQKEQMCKFAYKCHNHYKVYGDFKIEEYYNETFNK